MEKETTALKQSHKIVADETTALRRDFTVLDNKIDTLVIETTKQGGRLASIDKSIERIALHLMPSTNGGGAPII